MVEKMRRINNPLTIIAIFAALSEVAGTVAVGLIPESIQYIFIWFVMLFPSILVIGFFITLNFNPRVLYAPSDYENEDNFADAILGKIKQRKNYEDIEEKILKMNEEISNIIPKTKKAQIEVFDQKFKEILNSMNEIKTDSYNDLTSKYYINEIVHTNSNLQSKICEYLSINRDSDIETIAMAMRNSITATSRALTRLIERKIVCESINNGKSTFNIAINR